MSKFIKELLTAELETTLSAEDISDFVVVSLKGLTGNQNNELRAKLRENGIRVLVVKNSLFRKALESKNMGQAGSIFQGTCAVVFGGDSVVDVAKQMIEWKRKLKAMELKGAFTDGDVFDAAGVIELSKMPSRVELQGSIIVLALSPARKVASAIMSPASAIAGCLKTIVDKGEEAA